MIRSVGTAVFCGILLVLFIIIIPDWLSPVKFWWRESKQLQHSDVDASEPCNPCPSRWLNYEGKCYFFSEEEKDWPSSQSFCASYGSSLAVIETEIEKKFILQYGCSIDHWIGLHKEPDDHTWKWVDGTKLNNMLEVKGEGGDCAFVNSDSAVSSRCHRMRNWICSHPNIPTKKRQYSSTKHAEF